MTVDLVDAVLAERYYLESLGAMRVEWASQIVIVAARRVCWTIQDFQMVWSLVLYQPAPAVPMLQLSEGVIVWPFFILLRSLLQRNSGVHRHVWQTTDSNTHGRPDALLG